MLLRTSEPKGTKRPMLTPCGGAPLTLFQFAYGFATRRLAYVLDSLVRVSRRVGGVRFGGIILSPRVRSPELFRAQELMPPFPGKPLRKAPLGRLRTQMVPFWSAAGGVARRHRFLLNGFKSFNPLFKVLFIFPSQYLFAIGFPSVFSLGRSLSPN